MKSWPGLVHPSDRQIPIHAPLAIPFQIHSHMQETDFPQFLYNGGSHFLVEKFLDISGIDFYPGDVPMLSNATARKTVAP